jgi:hypothetical protein
MLQHNRHYYSTRFKHFFLLSLALSLYLPRLFGLSIVFWYACCAPFHSSSVIMGWRIISLSALELILDRGSNVIPFPLVKTWREVCGFGSGICRRVSGLSVNVDDTPVQDLPLFTTLLSKATTLLLVKEATEDCRLWNGGCDGGYGWRRLNGFHHWPSNLANARSENDLHPRMVLR